MRILLDESLPKDLATLIVGHEVSTVRAAGWSGIKNGKLLALASTRFDVQAIEPLVPELLKLLNDLPAKALRRVGV